MTEEELKETYLNVKLKQEVEKYISFNPTEGANDFVVYKVKVGENAFSYVVEHKKELSSSDWIKMYEGTERECYRVVGYLDSAEPREKRIAELEQQIKKMKCCANCKHSRTEYEHCRTNKHEKWEIKENDYNGN